MISYQPLYYYYLLLIITFDDLPVNFLYVYRNRFLIFKIEIKVEIKVGDLYNKLYRKL